jgi:2-C-methyl-D-erythritol 4-phosphate cytidylyltransferase
MKKERIVAIVPAAGLGKRFGQEENKPFCYLLGKPLIIWSLEALQNIEEITEIIPVLKESDLIACSELIEQYSITKVKRIVPGGKERQDSVYNGIKILDEKTSAVLIHDGVRPLVKPDLIRKAIMELKDFDGVITGVPVKDTIKEARTQRSVHPASRSDSEDRGQSASGGTDDAETDIIVQKTLYRDVLWSIQTPQVFYYQQIKDAYEKAAAERYYATDDAALVEKYGGNIKIIMGSYSNIKITTPEDIFIAEALILAHG